MSFFEKITRISPDLPDRTRKACLVLAFGMFYGLMSGMGIGMILVQLGVTFAKEYFLVSMGITAVMASGGLARTAWTASPRGLGRLACHFMTGVIGAVIPLVVTIFFMGHSIRYGFLIGAIAGLIITVGLLRSSCYTE